MNGITAAFQGRIGTEPELRFTQAATAMLAFNVAVTTNRPNGDGAETQWVRITVWDELAQQHAESLRKGDEVYIEGRLRLNEWTAGDGQRRTGLSCSAWTLQPLGNIGRRATQQRTEERMPERDAIAPAARR